MIAVSVTHLQGDFELVADFEADAGITAIFGASGAGKTTLIQVVAGLVRPRQASIVVDGIVWNDSRSNLFMPAHRRAIGYVFQEGRLFPHMTVSQNLAYGRFFRANRQDQVQRDDIIDLLGIGALLGARPARLSGGEKSRVAIGRALLASPRLLLMDEPLASLDYARKLEILPYIERIRSEWKIPVLYVSHSRDEVMRLADRVLLMEQGRIIESGPASILSDRQIQPSS